MSSQLEGIEEVFAFVRDREEPVKSSLVAEEFDMSPRSARRRLNRLAENDRVTVSKSDSGAKLYATDHEEEPEVNEEPEETDSDPFGDGYLLSETDREYLRFGDLNEQPELWKLTLLYRQLKSTFLQYRFGRDPKRADIQLLADRVGIENIEETTPADLLEALEETIRDSPIPFHLLYGIERNELTRIDGPTAKAIRKGLSDIPQREIADVIDRDPAAVSRWENGGDNFSQSIVQRIQRHLHDAHKEQCNTEWVSPAWRLPDNWERESEPQGIPYLAFRSCHGETMQVEQIAPANLQDAENPDPNKGQRYIARLRDADGETVTKSKAFGKPRDASSRALELIEEREEERQ